MLRLLRVSIQDYRTAPARLTLIVAGIASGVALIAALGIINQTVLKNFRTMLERAAGKAALEITLGSGEVGFDESVVEIAAEAPEVHDAFGLVRGTLAVADESGETLQLFGVDLLSKAIDSYDVKIVRRPEDELLALNDSRAIYLTEELVARLGLSVGDSIEVATPTGVKELHLRGLLKATGIATLFGGNLAVMDLPAAQILLGKDRLVDQIDLILEASSSVPDAQKQLQARLPTSLSVERPALRGERFERAIGAFQAMLDGLSLLCLLAGVFIVYNVTATAVTQRARDLSIFMALGAERRSIFALVATESAVLGFVSSLLGVLLGLGLAHALLSFVAQSMGVIYQTRFDLAEIALSWQQVFRYTLMGTGAALLAALVPARKASRLDPLELMRPDYREKLAITSPNRLLLSLWAVVLCGAAAAIYVEQTTRSIAWGNVGASLWYLSAVLVAIPIMNGITSLLRRFLPRWFGLEGRIAAESLNRSPGRTGVTTAVIALSLTLAVTFASVANSFRESERNWFILTGDLVLSAVATEGGWLETPLSAAVEEELRSVPGVERVETYRALQGQAFRDGRIAVVAVSPGFIDSALFRGQVAAGDPESAVDAIRKDSGVVVSDNLADRFRLAVGDEIDLPTPAGPRSFPVAAVIAADYSGDQGSVLIHRDRFSALWQDSRVSHFNVFLNPGASLEAARTEIAKSLGRKYRAKVLTVAETLAYHQGMVDRAFVFTYAIQLLVVAVTLAGIFDLLTTQMLERRQELGIFRALGAEHSHIRRSIILEAAVIGLAGTVLGAVLSVGTSLLWVHVNFRILIGYIIEHHFAVGTALWCIALVTAMAMLAGHLAARSALQHPVLEALRTE